jgi:hypothetical protein
MAGMTIVAYVMSRNGLRKLAAISSCPQVGERPDIALQRALTAWDDEMHYCAMAAAPACTTSLMLAHS